MVTFRYNCAIISRVPDSFESKSQSIDLAKARKQIEGFSDTLRKIGIDVLELPADERHPDCVFVGDCAVVLNGTALICRPASHSRVGEEAVVRQTLKKDLGLKIVEIDNERAILEGRDVLWTGKEFIVGINGGTNMDGAQAVANAFPEYPTTYVNLPDEKVRLQQYVSVIDENVLATSNSEIATKIFKQIQEHASFKYKVMHVEEDKAATNVLYVNGFVLHQDPKVMPKSFPIFERNFDSRVACDLSEFLKVDGVMTSCCILVSKVKHPKMIPTTLEGGQHELEA